LVSFLVFIQHFGFETHLVRTNTISLLDQATFAFPDNH